jgi:hypothetical protein
MPGGPPPLLDVLPLPPPLLEVLPLPPPLLEVLPLLEVPPPLLELLPLPPPLPPDERPPLLVDDAPLPPLLPPLPPPPEPPLLVLDPGGSDDEADEHPARAPIVKEKKRRAACGVGCRIVARARQQAGQAARV